MTKEQTMSPLRTRMIEDMQLAGLSAKTQEVYLQAVCVHQIEMSLFLPFRNVTPRWLGSGGGQARSLAERSADRAEQIWRSSIVARVLTIIGTRESRGLAFHAPYFASSALWRASELLVPFANISLDSGTGLVD